MLNIFVLYNNIGLDNKIYNLSEPILKIPTLFFLSHR